MVIVYDMRSGEVVEQSNPCNREAEHPERKRREAPRFAPALRLAPRTVEPGQSPPAPAIFVGCYFDEHGD